MENQSRSSHGSQVNRVLAEHLQIDEPSSFLSFQSFDTISFGLLILLLLPLLWYLFSCSLAHQSTSILSSNTHSPKELLLQHVTSAY